MPNPASLRPVQYLLIGHVSKDVSPGGWALGGTVTYSGLTAQALGMQVGIVTSLDEGLAKDLHAFESVQIAARYSPSTTTFKNTETPTGRQQYLFHRADQLDLACVPEAWRHAQIVHLAPVAQEVDLSLVDAFPNALVGVTPQGWLRKWDSDGRVYFNETLPEINFKNIGATILSNEDVDNNEDVIQELASRSNILVVTEGAKGARLYWNGDLRYFTPPQVVEVDPTGAGDVFAAAFLTRLHKTRDPWEAARFATVLAANSVTRSGLDSIPLQSEIDTCTIQIQ